MFAIVLLIVLLGACVLGAVYGADSRLDEHERHGHRT
jgi:hypothetical protein